MSNNQEGVFAIICAMFVLFSALLNPLISVAISALSLIVFAIYKFLKKVD